MPHRRVLLVAAAIALASCSDDKFDQRYRDAEAQIRKEDKGLASELPGSKPADSRASEPSSPRP